MRFPSFRGITLQDEICYCAQYNRGEILARFQRLLPLREPRSDFLVMTSHSSNGGRVKKCAW